MMEKETDDGVHRVLVKDIKIGGVGLTFMVVDSVNLETAPPTSSDGEQTEKVFTVDLMVEIGSTIYDLWKKWRNKRMVLTVTES